jgi:hypothetical protein
MPDQLPLYGRGHITYLSAARKKFNILNELDHVPEIKKQYADLWAQRESIEALIRHHLRLTDRDTCTVQDVRLWKQGAFNVCVLVEVTSGGSNLNVFFRCPKPDRLHGIVDEKMRSEVGAYVWMQEKCPDIRIPHLFGFGLSDGRRYSHQNHRPFYVRILQYVRRSLYSLFRLPLLSQYVRDSAVPTIHTPYMLLESIGSDQVQMLSNTWERYKGDPERRQRLFRGMSQIMLSLARVPQSRIGSFHFNNDGTISLTNRYLSPSIAILENDGAPRTIQRNSLYSCTDAFVSDLLAFHDGRFLAQPNATFSENDCRGQMAVMTLLRAISHRHIKREYRNGPYLLNLTDVNPSNFFVDHDWNVKGLIDLEWICAQPPEMLEVPYWLTGCDIAEITDERYDEYDMIQHEFMDILEGEGHKMTMEHDIPVGRIMKDVWYSKGVWFWRCLTSVDAMTFLLEDHLCPSRCLSSGFERTLSEFWCEDAEDVVRKKLADKASYDELLKSRFA